MVLVLEADWSALQAFTNTWLKQLWCQTYVHHITAQHPLRLLTSAHMTCTESLSGGFLINTLLMLQWTFVSLIFKLYTIYTHAVYLAVLWTQSWMKILQAAYCLHMHAYTVYNIVFAANRTFCHLQPITFCSSGVDSGVLTLKILNTVCFDTKIKEKLGQGSSWRFSTLYLFPKATDWPVLFVLFLAKTNYYKHLALGEC